MAAIAARTASVLRPHLRAVCFVPQLTAALGFEDGGLIGLASLRKPTNKDLLFMIDISYSMDEIAAGFQQTTDAMSKPPTMKTKKYDNCRGICSSQDEQLESMRGHLCHGTIDKVQT